MKISWFSWKVTKNRKLFLKNLISNTRDSENLMKTLDKPVVASFNSSYTAEFVL